MLVKLPTTVNRLLRTTQCFRTDCRIFVFGCTRFVNPLR